jgi:hypothetical protein
MCRHGAMRQFPIALLAMQRKSDCRRSVATAPRDAAEGGGNPTYFWHKETLY